MKKGDVVKDRYEICGVIGRGSFGVVYDVYDKVLKKYWVMKVLSQVTNNDAEHEALVLRNIQKDGIPRVTDIFCHEDVMCIIMECMEGISLGEWIKQNQNITRREIYMLSMQLIELVAYLHGLTPPVICGDIKPENFMMRNDGKLQMIDFGASRRMGEICSKIYGTYGYAPEEQIRGDCLNTRCDVYAIGRIICFLLTGINPAIPPYEVNIGFLSRREKEFLVRCMDKDPEMRFRDASELLEKFLKVKSKFSFLSINRNAIRFRIISTMYYSILTISVIFITIGVDGVLYRQQSDYRWYVLFGIIGLFLAAIIERYYRRGEAEQFIIRVEEAQMYTEAKKFEL